MVSRTPSIATLARDVRNTGDGFTAADLETGGKNRKERPADVDA
jgi:hypothetical protein